MELPFLIWSTSHGREIDPVGALPACHVFSRMYES
jgi:hypothetical protein